MDFAILPGLEIASVFMRRRVKELIAMRGAMRFLRRLWVFLERQGAGGADSPDGGSHGGVRGVMRRGSQVLQRGAISFRKFDRPTLGRLGSLLLL